MNAAQAPASAGGVAGPPARRVPWRLLVPALLLLLSAGIHAPLSRYAFDDAYIHFRLAEQFAATGRPHYNPGEAVLAGSSPAWLLLLSTLARLGLPVPAGAAVANAVLLAIGGTLAGRIVEQAGGSRAHPAFHAGSALAYVSIVHYSSLGLMETPLALALLCAAILLLLRGRRLAFVLLGAAPFVRPELVVCSALLALLAAARGRARPAAIAGLAAAGAAPFVAFELAYYGTLVPQTVAAKSTVYVLSAREALALFAEHLQPFLAAEPSRGTRWGVTLLALAWAGLVVPHELHRPRQRDDATWVALGLLLSGLLVAGAYVVTRSLVFPWYVPVVLVPLALGAGGLTLGTRSRWCGGMLAALCLLTLAPALGRTGLASLGEPARYAYAPANARVRQYLAVGRRLFERFPRATLLSSEIGGLGYAFRGRVHDGAGLVSPGALAYHPLRVPEERTHGFLGAIPVGFVEAVDPELIVSLDIFIEAFLHSEARRRYLHLQEPIYTPEDGRALGATTLWGSRHLNVFIRKDLLIDAASGPAGLTLGQALWYQAGPPARSASGPRRSR